MADTFDRPIAPPPAYSGAAGYVDWPAIFAGAVTAAAIAFIFSTFGAALGLSFVSPYKGEGSALAALIAVALWMLWTTASSFMAGGYLAGRLRRRVDGATEAEVHARDGAHGLIVWAVGIVIGGVLLASAGATTARVGGAAVEAGASVAGGAVKVASAAASGAQTQSVDPFAYASDSLFRTDGASPPASTSVRDEAKTILGSVLRNGEIADADRAYLAALVARETGLSEAEAAARADGIVTSVEQAAAEARSAAADAETALIQAADAARKYTIVSAFLFAAALMIAGAGSYWAAGIGGRHRDEGRDFARFGRWA